MQRRLLAAFIGGVPERLVFLGPRLQRSALDAGDVLNACQINVAVKF
jgi:hypothetical protein